MSVFRSAMRSVKGVNYTDIENKVREATSNDPWGASSSAMREISMSTRNNIMEYPKLFAMLWKRLMDREHPRHVHKALLLLEYMLRHADEMFIEDVRRRRRELLPLIRYRFYQNGQDVGVDIRHRAEAVMALLDDADKLEEERQKAQELVASGKFRAMSGGGAYSHRDESYRDAYGAQQHGSGRSGYAGAGAADDDFGDDQWTAPSKPAAKVQHPRTAHTQPRARPAAARTPAAAPAEDPFAEAFPDDAFPDDAFPEEPETASAASFYEEDSAPAQEPVAHTNRVTPTKTAPKAAASPAVVAPTPIVAPAPIAAPTPVPAPAADSFDRPTRGRRVSAIHEKAATPASAPAPAPTGDAFELLGGLSLEPEAQPEQQPKQHDDFDIFSTGAPAAKPAPAQPKADIWSSLAQDTPQQQQGNMNMNMNMQGMQGMQGGMGYGYPMMQQQQYNPYAQPQMVGMQMGMDFMGGQQQQQQQQQDPFAALGSGTTSTQMRGRPSVVSNKPKTPSAFDDINPFEM